MASFQIPKTPEELLEPDSECLHVKQITELSELAPQALLSFAESKIQEFETVTVEHPISRQIVLCMQVLSMTSASTMPCASVSKTSLMGSTALSGVSSGFQGLSA